jgi:hypothetical protein
MRITAHTEPSEPDRPNEDWVTTSPNLVVVLDGVTARTDTGCTHGTSWYVAHLGAAITAEAHDATASLGTALGTAIQTVVEQHRSCDLHHPGTPAAAVGIFRIVSNAVDYLVLGDITVLLHASDGIRVVVDQRVDSTACPERSEVDCYPIGSPEKSAALLRMKRCELAARNRPGGDYWIASSDPAAAGHALTGGVRLDGIRRAAVLTDGGARLVDPFASLDWPGLLDLLGRAGPVEAIQRVRTIEASDPDGIRWPRNKRHDDATIVFLEAQ